MSHPRLAPLPILVLLVSAASGQSVRSTHSGLLYFFDGYVFLGDQQLQQKFGRFPELAEGGVLRTELGRAEVLLTPGVFLRVAENSSIRMLSNRLSDTRIELLRGSAIIEVSHEASNPSDTLIYKDWQVRIAHRTASLESIREPAQVRVLSGSGEVFRQMATPRSPPFSGASFLPEGVRAGRRARHHTRGGPIQHLGHEPQLGCPPEDNQDCKSGITDDPDQLDTSGIASGGFAQLIFLQTGIASLGITYRKIYGLSFWSPGQSYQTWFNPYLSAYPYGVLYQRPATSMQGRDDFPGLGMQSAAPPVSFSPDLLLRPYREFQSPLLTSPRRTPSTVDSCW